MVFNNFFANGKANSSTIILLNSIEPLKHFKNTFFVMWVKPDTVIGNSDTAVSYFWLKLRNS